MTVHVRFAPSPTGLLHVGNARIALINWLFARQRGGRFLLRLDDTDLERSEARFATAIEEDLRWLGLDWDELARQSDRMPRYEAAVARLKAAGRLYPCYETPEELEFRRRRQLARGEPPRYDRAALKLDAAERARYEAAGREPYWRFRLHDSDIAWSDLVRGPVRFEAAHLSDPVLVRADGRPLYTLTSVVDDLEFAISHVIRGEDHVANTAVQLQLAEALGGSADDLAFAHLPLLADAGGGPLSKRLGSLSLAQLREEGLEPMAAVSLLARLGTPDPVEPASEPAALVRGFDLSRFGRATPRFDLDELMRVNAAVLQQMPFENVAARLRAMGADEADDRFWQAVRPNLGKLADALEWHEVCFGRIAPVVQEPHYLAAAARLLPPEPWDAATWGAWTRALQEATGRKGRSLYLPIRLALTGRPHGPEMQGLLPLIGRGRTLQRLTEAAPAPLAPAAGVVVPLKRH